MKFFLVLLGLACSDGIICGGGRTGDTKACCLCCIGSITCCAWCCVTNVCRPNRELTKQVTSTLSVLEETLDKTMISIFWYFISRTNSYHTLFRFPQILQKKESIYMTYRLCQQRLRLLLGEISRNHFEFRVQLVISGLNRKSS